MPELIPHAEPPTDPSVLDLPITELSCPWWRSHGADLEAVYFGRSGDNRYDAPDGQYGILYIAQHPFGAFAETYLRITSGTPALITMASLSAKHVTTIEFDSPLRLVDLTGPGLHSLGADNRLTCGDLGLSQRWALAFWNHPDQPDGILYRSRHDPEMTCCGVFDRRHDARSGHSLGPLAAPSNIRLLSEILDRYHIPLLM